MASECNSDVKGMKYDPSCVFSRGSSNFIFRGSFCGTLVAVKRLQLVEINSSKSTSKYWEEKESALRQLVHHNIVNLIHIEGEPSFRLFAFEMCSASIDQLFLPESDPRKFSGPMPTHRQTLLEITQGLQYIHSKGFFICCFQPKNVLISRTGEVKLSSWCVVKSATNHYGKLIAQGSKGILDWMAPEFIRLLLEDLNSEIMGSVEGDTFSSGCVFFYLVSGGIHPFGNTLTTAGNVTEGKPVNMSKLDEVHFAYDVIRRMIRRKPHKRILLRSIVDRLSEPRFKFVKTLQEIGQKKCGPPRPERKRKLDQMSGQSSTQCETAEINSTVPVVLTKSPLMSFHPFDPLLAYYSCSAPLGQSNADYVTLWIGANHTSPFSTWTQGQKFPFSELIQIHSVSCLEWSTDGMKLAAGFDCGSFIIWNKEGDIVFQNLEGGRSFDVPFPLSNVAFVIRWNPFNPTSVIFQTKRTLALVDLKLNALLPRLLKRNDIIKWDGIVKGVEWIAIDTLAVSYCNWPVIEIWKINQVNPIQTLNIGVQGYYSGTKSIAWNDSLQILVSSEDNHLKVWLNNGKVDPTINVFQHDCRALCVCLYVPAAVEGDDSRHLVACGVGRFEILVFSAHRNQEDIEMDIVAKLNKGSSNKSVDDLSFSPDGRFLASVDSVGSVAIWSTKAWEQVGDFKREEKRAKLKPYRVIWGPTGCKLVVYHNPCNPFSQMLGGISLIEYLPQLD